MYELEFSENKNNRAKSVTVILQFINTHYFRIHHFFIKMKISVRNSWAAKRKRNKKCSDLPEIP